MFEKYFLKSIIFRPKSKSVFAIFGTKIQIFEKLHNFEFSRQKFKYINDKLQNYENYEFLRQNSFIE